ncbi:MAG: beta-ketoacyl synthase chain length factor [Crocinitomicaceae bacterium]
MFYIHAISSITHQNSFRSEDVNENLEPISEESVLKSPDYKEYISPVALRRLSPVLRMGIAAAKECEKEVGKPFDAISVGTALGCLTDTEKFLKVINTVEGDVLSPTSFIQSTHNTIAGQISLDLGNHSYNMTHTQNNLSFEMALIDGMLCCKEGAENVLVGTADEAIEFLNSLKPSIFLAESNLTSGATFMAISPVKKASSVAVLDCSTHFGTVDLKQEIEIFLAKNDLGLATISRIFTNTDIDLVGEKILYEDFSGLYFSSAAFGTHMAHDWLQKNPNKYALVVNTGCSKNTGLILLKNDQA